MQETFARVWKHIGEASATPPDRIRFWVLAIAKNQFRDFQRRQAVRQRTETALKEQAEREEPRGNPARIVEMRTEQERIAAAICDLPEPLRVMLTLRLAGELTSEEIGALLNRPAGTVRYQLSQARKILAKSLEKEGF